MQVREAEKGHYMYAHDIAGSHIPELVQELHIPKYFINNIQDVSSDPGMTVEQMIKETFYPTIFFGAPGSNSPLHTDGARPSKADSEYCNVSCCACQYMKDLLRGPKASLKTIFW